MGELRAVTGGPMATPTLVIDGDVRVGFDPEWIDEKLLKPAADDDPIT